MNQLLKEQIGQIVAHDYRTAAVFKAKGIDYCCRGNLTLQEVLCEKMIDEGRMICALQEAMLAEPQESLDFSTWPLDLLVDYIEKKHHRYARAQMMLIGTYLQGLLESYGETNPELNEINNLCTEETHELTKHMEKEEEMLFPTIRNIVAPEGIHDESACVPASLLKYMVDLMIADHTHEAERWKRIKALVVQSKLSSVEAGMAFKLLGELEEDLRMHFHLETNILFPSALLIKQEKMKASLS